jgi:uncharacterized protein YodC (DUF2158 family)
MPSEENAKGSDQPTSTSPVPKPGIARPRSSVPSPKSSRTAQRHPTQPPDVFPSSSPTMPPGNFSVGDVVHIEGMKFADAVVKGFHPRHQDELILCAWDDRSGNHHEVYHNVKNLVLVKAAQAYVDSQSLVKAAEKVGNEISKSEIIHDETQ